MSEPENNKTKKRRFWQIHLSTAILFVVASSFLLWLSLVNPVTLSEFPGFVYQDGYGWPYAWETRSFPYGGDLAIDSWSRPAIFWDGLVAVAALSGITICGEWLIRRREGRKP